MINFLISRPVSVLMTFTALFILGVITYLNIPVSLLPDIAIPEITVQVTGGNTSARELENTVVSTVRQQLLQLSKLRDIRTETRDGSAIVRLSFEFGANTDLAFIEVNEKIDAAMNYLPREIERPRVIKASVTDIPVQYLMLTLTPNQIGGEERFMELSEFAETVIKRRIEQLPQVAMVDISGMMKKQVVIIPDKNLLETSGITLADLEWTLNNNNVEPGSMTVRDGYYEYNIRFSAVLRTIEDIRNIFIRKNNRIYRLKDLANVELTAEKENGMVLYNGKRAVALSIIKQSEENMDNLQRALTQSIAHFQRDYPDIEFSVSQNQTELLDYSISNLKQNLLLAFLFVCLVSVFFMKDLKSPLIMGVIMFVSLVITFLFFYLFHISLNVVSLTGLILALGMMIDNSIIVTDNITQYRQMGYSIEDSCIRGTNEVITPMLSSSLTTISVFFPLIFLSGIAGAIFFDQAFSVTAGLFVSFMTGIALLPVLCKLFFKGNADDADSADRRRSLFLKNKYISKFYSFIRVNPRSPRHPRSNKKSAIEKMYDAGSEWIFSHKRFSAILIIAVFPLCFWLFTIIPKERMPQLSQSELIAYIEWNENIHVEENETRCRELLDAIRPYHVESSALVAQQQFLLNRERELTSTETEFYLRTVSPDNIPALKEKISRYLQAHFPLALVSFSPMGTVFEKIFSTGDPDLVVEYYKRNKSEAPGAQAIRELENKIGEKTGEKPAGVSFQEQLNLSIDREKLLLYNVSYDEVYRTLKTAFKDNRFATLRSYQQYLPIVLGGEEKTVKEVVENTLVTGANYTDGVPVKIPLSVFVSVTGSEDLKTIVAGKSGEYIPLEFYRIEKPEKIMQAAKEESLRNRDWDVDFSGNFFSNKKMINELMVILLISILLMYFILAAQFENFLQPVIVLLEIPIDICASLALLLALGHTLNLMSAIGLVISCGIIINDSILKMDMMNQLRASGMPLMEAIHEAGRRRLKAIVMTSLTSIVCMAPLFWSADLGAALEKPLALGIIGGMVIGTPVSLFVVPLLYWRVYRMKNEK